MKIQKIKICVTVLGLAAITCVALFAKKPAVTAAFLHSQSSASQQSSLEPVYKLTKQELEEWATYENAAQAYNQAVSQIVNAASQLPLEQSNSTRIHAELREARLSLNFSQMQQQSFLWRLRAKNKCEICEIQNGELKIPTV